eukprot:4371397-Alexandrium_andersonii.AAC.1
MGDVPLSQLHAQALASTTQAASSSFSHPGEAAASSATSLVPPPPQPLARVRGPFNPADWNIGLNKITPARSLTGALVGWE